MGFAKYMEDNFERWTENTRYSDPLPTHGILLNGLAVVPAPSPSVQQVFQSGRRAEGGTTWNT